MAKLTKTYVYYANVSDLNIEKKIKKIPDFRQKKANEFVQEKDKKMSIGVYLLLKKVLRKHGVSISKYKFEYNKNGRPFLKNCKYYFSLSHSENMVAVALSQDLVGVDIQYMREINPNIHKLIFNNGDQSYYDKQVDKHKAFYNIWSNKEAYAKFTGTGLNENFKNIDIIRLIKNKKCFFNNYLLKNDYQISVCSRFIRKIKIKETRI